MFGFKDSQIPCALAASDGHTAGAAADTVVRHFNNFSNLTAPITATTRCVAAVEGIACAIGEDA